MMQRPWDCAQPDEWLPQSLRLCWGSDGGGDGGGGWSGDSGGWSGDSGGGWGDGGFASTGGGDWGSAGSFDASGFNAGGDIGAWAGSAYDASTAGTGAGVGGDWGSFGATNYSGFNAPNAVFTDIAGPNPGVTTGGGDWGSAGVSSFAGTGGAPGGAMAGPGFWGGGDQGGGFGFGGDTGGGGFYGGGGGGGGLYGGGGGSFGGFGTAGTAAGGTLGGPLGASNAVSSVNGPAFADTAGPGSLAGPAGQASSGAPTTSEAQSESAEGSESEAAPSDSEAAPTSEAAPADFGTPTTTEAAPAQDEAAPEVSSTIAGGRETNFDYGQQAAPAEQEAAPSSFGPESVTSQEGRQALSDLTQSALAPDPANYEGSPYATLSPADVNWGAMFEAPSDPGYQPDAREGPMGPIAEPGWFQSLISDIPGVTTPAWAQDVGRSLSDVNTWLAPQNQGAVNFLTNLNWDPSTWANVAQPWTAFDLQALGEQGKAGQIAGDLASQLGLENVGDIQGIDPGSEQYGTEAYAPGGIDPSAEQYGVTNQQDLASQLGIENLDTTPWGSVFEAPELAPDYASVFEAPAQDPWGSVFEGAPSVDPNAPTIDPTVAPPDAAHPYAETLDTGQPGAQLTTDDATTPGGDPALSGAAAAGALGQLGQPATAPAQGGQTFVSDAAVSAIANATSNAALDVGAPPQAGDAASQAAHNAALNLASPSEIATAAMAAALENGATQAQADAIAAAALNAANNQPAFIPGQPGQEQQAPPGQQQPGAPEGEQTTSTTSAFIPGQLQTNFEYAPSQPAPQSLIDMAPAQPGQPQAQAQPSTQAFIPGGKTTDFNYPSATSTGIDPGAEQYGFPDDDHDTPEPPDTSPPQDPNAPRPPGNIPGQLIGARDNYPNSQLDNPRNPFYRDSGRTDYPQGRPGVTYRTARQAGVEPNFHVGDYNVQDLDARLVENINRAIVDMERAGIPNTLTVSSAYRPMTRAEALERGMDPRTSQESVYARGNAPGGRHFAAARPGGSNHAPGRAIDFNPGLSGRALTWLRANAGHYGLETLGSRGGRPFDVPHIQLQGARGIANVRPSAQEQAQQRALDAQTREANAGRGQAPTQQAAAPPGGWRGIGSDRSDIAWTEQPDVARPPADIPVPTNLPPQAPQETRPPADIPAPAPRGPNEFDIPVTPPVRNATVIANNILKQATAHLNTNSDTAALNAAGVVAAKAMAAAGIPANLARSLMLKGALDGAIANGYGPGGKNSTVMGFSIWGKVQSTITDSINAAMQGYQPAKPGELQGPPAPEASLRGLAKGGHVKKDEPVVVGEEGPEFFVPDTAGTVFPHMPQPGKTRKSENIDRWPKIPAPNFPGRYGGVEREMMRQTRAAQDIRPSLIDMIDSGRLPLNAANWQAMMTDPALIALGQSRIEDNRQGIDPGAEQYGAFVPPPAPAAEPPDPANPMAQALGYGSIQRRPMQIGRQSYQR